MIRSETQLRLSAASYVEICAVVDPAGDPVSSRRIDEIIKDLSIIIEAVTPAQATVAREAYKDFGKGSGSAANLNFGDCFSYALAKSYSEPILFKGNDFSQTDLEPAIRSTGRS